MKFLLSRGVRVEGSGHGRLRETPLHFACKDFTQECANGRLEGVKLLIDRGAQVDAKASEGRTPLHFVCLDITEESSLSRLEVARVLLGQLAPVDAKERNGCTPLHYACGADGYFTK